MCSKENWRCSFSGERRSSWWGGEGKRGEGERGSEWWTLDELQHESGLNDRLIISWRRSLHTLILSANQWTGFDMAGASDIKDRNFSHISNRVLNKNVPAFFLTMSHSSLIAIIWCVLKACFTWKQLKTDYSKNIWKEENHGRGFVYHINFVIYQGK